RTWDIDAFFISHAHADHCLDLLPLYVLLKHAPVDRGGLGERGPIPVYGPRELPERLVSAYSTAGDNDFRQCFDFRPLPDGGATVPIGDLSVSASRVAHPGESYALRFESAGSSLVYSGDTGECDALLKLARDADTALFEASFVEPAATEPALPANLHMTGRQAGDTARRAGVRQLIITHLVEWNRVDGRHDREQREAAVAFGKEVEVAQLGRTFTIGAAG
ncbi:MAG: hypothetical protein RL745_242, partial [Actinomycetota bacterium]